MPKPKKGERKKSFIKRCIPYLYKEKSALTSKKNKNKQAYAICNSIFDKNKKNENILFFNDFINEEYSYVEKDDFLKIKKLIEPVIIKKISEINNLNINDFIKNSFINYDIWEDIIIDKRYVNNIYGLVDRNINKKNYTTPEIRNSIFKILNEIYKEYNIKRKLDNKLIKIISNDPVKYGYILKNYNINKYVYKSLEWIIKTNNYNL